MNKQSEIVVYGAEQICASCVGMPSSVETYEWLEAAIARKFPNQPFIMTYVDIFHPPTEDQEKVDFARRVVNEEFFYPVVTINGVVVGEGNPKLKSVYQQLEECGYES
ncbi:YuzD family protein [Bacillus niameyensis]|uniref:YuzD family protein n=1 Tax=Bacillus niameyensis TaxID=1522308 RepID=UPI0007849A42